MSPAAPLTGRSPRVALIMWLTIAVSWTLLCVASLLYGSFGSHLVRGFTHCLSGAQLWLTTGTPDSAESLKASPLPLPTRCGSGRPPRWSSSLASGHGGRTGSPGATRNPDEVRALRSINGEPR